MNSMHQHDRARAFVDDRGATAASIGELLAMSAFSAPCCSHIALCDGACRDARPDALSDEGDRPRRFSGHRFSGDFSR